MCINCLSNYVKRHADFDIINLSCATELTLHRDRYLTGECEETLRIKMLISCHRS